MKGFVDKVDRIRVEGKKPFDALVINGEKYSCFDTGLSKTLSEGDHVDFEYQTSGDYKNISKLEILRRGEGAPAPTQHAEITKMCALKAAAEYSKSQNLLINDVLKVADAFLEWIKGD